MTAEFCREQEALQLAKAKSEPLENRRAIAVKAAKAWADEAVLREQRAAKAGPLDKLDRQIAQELADEDAASTTGP